MEEGRKGVKKKGLRGKKWNYSSYKWEGGQEMEGAGKDGKAWNKKRFKMRYVPTSRDECKPCVLQTCTSKKKEKREKRKEEEGEGYFLS